MNKTFSAKTKQVEFNYIFKDGNKKAFIFKAPSTTEIQRQIEFEQKCNNTAKLLKHKQKIIKESISGDNKQEMIDELMSDGNLYEFGAELTALLGEQKQKK